MQHYPKSLYRGNVDDHRIVADEAEEESARAEGYEMYAEIHAREHADAGEPKKPAAKKKAAE